MNPNDSSDAVKGRADYHAAREALARIVMNDDGETFGRDLADRVLERVTSEWRRVALIENEDGTFTRPTQAQADGPLPRPAASVAPEGLDALVERLRERAAVTTAHAIGVMVPDLLALLDRLSAAERARDEAHEVSIEMISDAARKHEASQKAYFEVDAAWHAMRKERDAAVQRAAHLQEALTKIAEQTGMVGFHPSAVARDALTAPTTPAGGAPAPRPQEGK